MQRISWLWLRGTQAGPGGLLKFREASSGGGRSQHLRRGPPPGLQLGSLHEEMPAEGEEPPKESEGPTPETHTGPRTVPVPTASCGANLRIRGARGEVLQRALPRTLPRRWGKISTYTTAALDSKGRDGKGKGEEGRGGYIRGSAEGLVQVKGFQVKTGLKYAEDLRDGTVNT